MVRMVQPEVRAPSCTCTARADLSVVQLAVSFRVVLIRSLRRSLRHPSSPNSHCRRRHRSRGPNDARQLPVQLARPSGLLALSLDSARSSRRRTCSSVSFEGPHRRWTLLTCPLRRWCTQLRSLHILATPPRAQCSGVFLFVAVVLGEWEEVVVGALGAFQVRRVVRGGVLIVFVSHRHQSLSPIRLVSTQCSRLPLNLSVW